MIPVKSLSLKHDIGNDDEDYERHALLQHLQLYEREGTSVAVESETVGWHLTAILQKAIAQLKAITPMRGQWALTPVCCNLRCPYHANVMKTLLSSSNNIVYNPFMSLSFRLQKRYSFYLTHGKGKQKTEKTTTF